MIKIKKIKKIRIMKSLTFIAIVCVAAIFTGCKEDDDPIDIINPVITLTSPVDGASQIAGTPTTLAFSANSANGLKRVVVKFKSATGTETTKFDTALTSQPQDFGFSRNYTVGPVGTETYTISVTDKNDKIETKSVNIKSITGFEAEDFGSYFHILGTKPGGFDLVKLEQRVVTDSDNDKDMENSDAASVFTGGWMAKNSTLFVKASGFDYSTGTIIDAKQIYASGTPSASVLAPANGDMYIAKIRGMESYAVIKIISNETLNDECGCANKGKLTFNIKKSI